MTLNGYDVASYQQGMDVGKVASDFVIVKATEGLSYVNPYCNGHVEQALNAGKKLGLYHFANYGTDANAEADYFLSNIANYVGKAVLILDYEANAVKNGVDWAKQWLDRVYEKTGVRPLIYLGLSDENAYDWSSVVNANYGVWIAQYNNYNVVNGFSPRDIYGSVKHWPTTAMFQYTSSGRLPGWSGNLDFNVFYGDKDAWDAYTKASKTVTPSQPVEQSKPAATSVATSETFVDDLGVTWYKQTGTFTSDRDINLRYGATTKSTKIATLNAGSEVDYDAYCYSGGYVWIRQPRSNSYGYMATGNAKGTKRIDYWGSFK